MRFVPQKGGKPSRIPQGAPLAMFVSIQTHNIGPASITIDKIRIAPADRKQKPFLLENCWVAMKREEQLPKVIASGDLWEGWCDYQWLRDKLESSVAAKKVWDLQVIISDINGSQYKGRVVISDEIFNSLVQRHRVAGA
jgi:hypothetical protein